MSRYIKSKLKKIKSEMDEVKVLLSDSYRLFLQKIVHGITGRYDLKVIFSDGVYTDNKIISVNPVHECVMRLKKITEKTLAILGQLAHEIFHIIYTDFKVLQEMKEKHKKLDVFRMRQLHDCFNIIEDAAIEITGCNYYTGTFKQGIIALNKSAIECMPSLDNMAKEGAPRLAIFKQACAMYCIYGTLKGKLYDPELIDLLEKAIPILDRGRLEPHSKGRFKAAEELFSLMKPLIEEAIRYAETTKVMECYEYIKSDEISSGGPSAEVMEPPDIKEDFSLKEREKFKEKLKEMKGAGGASSSSGDKEKESDSSAASKGARKKSKVDDSSSDKKGEEKKEGKASEDVPGTSDKGKDSKDKDDDDDEKGAGGEESEKGDEKAEGSAKEKDREEEKKVEDKDGDKDKGDKETGEHDLEDDKAKDSEIGEEEEEGKREEEKGTDDGGDDEEDEMNEVLKSLEKQLEDVIEDAAKEEYDKQEQKEQDRRIREFARTVKFSELHSHIRPVTRREFEINEYIINKYNRTLEPIKGLARNLIKRMKDIIRYNEDLKVTGLISGKVNKSQLYRMGVDKLIFYKQKEKSDEADLAILLLIDESGSMNCDRRSYYAQQAAILLYEVCDALKIPLAVIGFDAKSYGDEVYHRHYVDFDSRDKREKYKLAYINARHENRDGYSVKYAGEYLARRPETDKILIVITDGEPMHPSTKDVYYGKLGVEDSGRAVKDLEKMGINVFGLAIGDGKSEIKKIYTKNYIDITNLKHLPERLANLIERNLLKE